ncbi:MAG: Ig-like domain-containing protein [Blautia sp.]
MRRQGKRILCMLIAVLMILTAMPVSVLAVSEEAEFLGDTFQGQQEEITVGDSECEKQTEFESGEAQEILPEREDTNILTTDEGENLEQQKNGEEDNSFSESTQSSQMRAPTIETTLVDGLQLKASKKTFDVIARDGEGNKIVSSVTLNGEKVDVNWDDDIKTSYTLEFTGREDGEYTVVVKATDSQGQTATKEYKIYYTKAEQGELIGYATFDIEALSINYGYLVEPVKVPVYEGENSAKALTRLILKSGYDYMNTGTIEANFYLSHIMSGTKRIDLKNASMNEDLKDMEINWTGPLTDSSLGEFDFANGSGWMYCLNNVFPNVGFSDSYLSDGDVVRVQFTLNLGQDIGGGGAVGGGSAGRIRADKDSLAAGIASVNSSQNKDNLLSDPTIKAVYENANQVMLDLPASQEDVDTASEALQSALDGDLPQKMEFKNKELTLENLSSQRLEVVYTPGDIHVPIQMEWSSSDSNVVEVDDNGMVIAKNKGTAIITASSGDWSDTCTVTVPEVPLEGIRFEEEKVELTRASKSELKPVFVPENTTEAGEIQWSSSDLSVAAVSDGQVLAVSPGTAEIAVQIGEHRAFTQVEVVEIPITGLEAEESQISIQPGSTKKVSYNILPEDTTDSKTATVVSSNPAVVTAAASGSGVSLKGIAAGEADVIAKVGRHSISYHVSVAEIKATNFEFDQFSENMTLKSAQTVSLKFEPVASPNDKDQVEWSSSNPEVVKIKSEKGVSGSLTAQALGTSVITAKLGEISKSFTVTVTGVPLLGISLDQTEVEIYRGGSASVRVQFDPVNTTDDKAITWTSSDPEIFTVSGGTTMYGRMTAKKAGTAVLTAAVGDYTATCQVTVKEKPQLESVSLSSEKMDLGVGKSSTLRVSYSPSNSSYSSSKLVWTTSDENVATVSKSGKVTGVSPGDAKITLTYDGNLEAVCAVTVKEYPVTGISFEKSNYEIEGLDSSVSMKFTLTPETYTDEVEFSFSSSDPSVAQIKSNTKAWVSVAGKGEGKATITVTAKTPGGAYTADTQVEVYPHYITAVAMKRGTFQVQRGKTLNLSSNYIFQPSDGKANTISWESSDDKVATVSSSGSVKAVEYGEAVITGTLHNGSVVTCKIQVTKPVTSLILSASKLGMEKGSSLEIDAISFEPVDGDMSEFSWASSNTKVLKVKDGLITAVGEGNATIYGIAGNAVATCEIVVTPLADEAKAVEVMGLIEQIGEVTLDSETAIKEARAAYDRLNRIQKAYVTNDEVLFAAERQLNEIRQVVTQATLLTSAKSIDYTTVELSWKSMGGAEGYRIYRKIPGGTFKAIANVEGQSTVVYKDSTAVTGVTYLYTVRAVYTQSGETHLGPYVKKGIQGKAVLSQTGLERVQSWGYNGLRLTWDKVDGASGYRIYGVNLKTGKYQYLAQVISGDTTTYVDGELTCGQTYTYKVRAFRNVQGEKVFGAYSSAMKGKPVPRQATISSVKKASSTSLEICWKKVNGASGYRIYRIDTKTGKYQYVTQVSRGSLTAYTEKGLRRNTSYQYRIRAYRTVNGEKIFGAYSSVVKGSTK